MSNSIIYPSIMLLAGMGIPVMTFEIWESKKAEKMHWEMEHLKSTLSELTPLLLSDATIAQ